MLGISSLQFQYNRLTHTKMEMKFAADETAATAALAVDIRSYSRGILKFDEAAAINSGNKIIENNMKYKLFKVKYNFLYADTLSPKVVVEISMDGMKVCSKYEYVIF